MAVILGWGCGGGNQAAQPSTPAQTEQPASPAGDPVVAACQKMLTLADEGCKLFSPLKRDQQQCVSFVNEYRARLPEDRRADATRHISCIVASPACAEAESCFRSFVLLADAGRPKACGEVLVGVVRLSGDEAEQRHGRTAIRFSSVTSTKEQPIEVCGLRDQLGWLVRATCDDGSNPFTSAGDREAALDRAHESRRGSYGPGGRCKSPIDMYVVTCPERTYEVHMDMYMCGPDESFR